MNPLLKIVNLKTRESFEICRSLIFGRLETSDIRIPEKTISRQHARLDMEKEGVFFSDLGSSNGSELNGVVVQGTHSVKVGDRIKIGTYEFEIQTISPLASEDLLAHREPGRVVIAVVLAPRDGIPASYPSEIIQSAWMKLAQSFVPLHEGRFDGEEGLSFRGSWVSGEISCRHKAVAAARSILLSSQKMDQTYPTRGISFAQYHDIQVMLDLEIQQVDSENSRIHPASIQRMAEIQKTISSQQVSLVATDLFLSGWEDAPIGKALGSVSGISLEQLSEV